MPITMFYASTAPSGFDSSEYRQNTYGAPDYYCDPTRSLASNGTGTLGNPWNLTQAQSQPVAGDVVGMLPGVGVALTSTDNDNFPTFTPANSGTAGNPIVYTAKYAAVALANIATNANRTQLTHDGTEPTQVEGVEVGTGSPMYGTNAKDYVIFDGLYVDMTQAWSCGDGGMIRAENGTGIEFRNFVLCGPGTTAMSSNPCLIRSQATLNLVYSNFKVYDFINDPTGYPLAQQGHAYIGYGDRNMLMEHYEVTNVERGVFPKGSNPLDVYYNYGRICFGKFYNVQQAFMVNDIDASNTLEIDHNLCDTYSLRGMSIPALTTATRNLLVHHNTFVRGDATDVNHNGVTTAGALGFTGTNVIRDNIFDQGAGSNGWMMAWQASSTVPSTLDYNGYYKSSGSMVWAYNADDAIASLAAWRTATGRETNSQVLTDPFVNRSGGDFHISNGHAALTASSTGGEIGCYEGGHTIGVVV